MLELQAKSDLIRELEVALPTHTAENPIMLSLETIRTALRRFMANEIDSDTLTSWADMLEMRDQILYEPGFEQLIAEVIFMLASPEINGPVNYETCQALLAKLGDK